MTVLVVDDEPSYRILLREILMSNGHDVLTAENGDEGLRKLSIVTPDIVISDIYMPIMDGVKFHRSVRSNPNYEKLPFLFVSGYSDDYTLNSMRDPRYDGFLRKGGSEHQINDWIEYLTTPEEKRSKLLPGQTIRPN